MGTHKSLNFHSDQMEVNGHNPGKKHLLVSLGLARLQDVTPQRNIVFPDGRQALKSSQKVFLYWL